MKHNAFAACHPAVNFLFFAAAIGFGVVLQHPAYLAAGCIGSGLCYLLIKGKSGFPFLGNLLILGTVLAGINPIFNTRGTRILFRLFGRPYTLEALCYGLALAGIFLIMMLWFACYNTVVTSDKFISLFGSFIPSLSLVLVMVLRMIPGLTRKARQITGARSAIGKGVTAASTSKEKVSHGMTVLSSLTDWALEGSLVTADSMRARGYGTTRQTHFQIYRFTARDGILLAVILLLSTAVIASGGFSASYTPELKISPVSGGFAAYCALLLLPSVLQIKEAVIWHILKSKI